MSSGSRLSATSLIVLLGPLSMLFWRIYVEGIGKAWSALSDPQTIHAFKISLILAGIAVPLNTVFGVVVSLAIVRRRFPGKGLVNAFVDLPLALSPVVVGLSLFLLYGRTGWFGPWFTSHNIQVLFALPAMVLATVFVSVPFVAREVVPTLREIGDEQEQAAHTLGASGWQTFWRITLPVDPLGRDLRRRPDHRPLPRRVRRGRRRLRQYRGQNRDGDPACAGLLREPEPGRRVRRLARTRRRLR